MKRVRLKILCTSLFAVVLFFASCKKEDDNAKYNSKGTYIPTKIDPFSIFPAELGMPSLPSDNPFTIEGVYLGRMLFYDPILSYDSSISCASCHKQEFAFSDPVAFSPGAFGLKTKRNA